MTCARSTKVHRRSSQWESGTRRRRWRWLDGKHRLLSRTHSASRALAWVPRQVCFQRGLDGSFGDGFDVLHVANRREAAGRREVAVSGPAAFAVDTAKAVVQ